jgi:hypothetical protein
MALTLFALLLVVVGQLVHLLEVPSEESIWLLLAAAIHFA